MNQLIIALGADHRGFAYKEWLKNSFKFSGHVLKWMDCGAFNEQRSDYPIFSKKVVTALLEQQAQYGILLCGTGVGMAITANRFKGMYAAVAWNEKVSALAKEDDNANILVVPTDFVSIHEMENMVRSWLMAQFNNGRYQQRLNMIDV